MQLLALSLPAMAATITVDRYGGADHTSIQDGINASQDGDTISVAAATYYEAIDFDGKDLEVVSTSGAATTVIDADGDSEFAVTFSNHEGTGALLDGFTVRNGSAQGVSITDASPRIHNSTFSELGSTSTNGGSVAIDGGSPSIDSCTFEGGTGNLGGYIYVSGEATVMVDDSTFEDAVANYGGSIYVDEDATLAMEDSRIDNGWTRYQGSGLYAHNRAVISLTDTDFRSNTGYYVHGGAIYGGEYVALTIDGGLFDGNGPEPYYCSSYSGGAIWLNSHASADITDTVFEDNVAYKGGAIYGDYNNVVTLTGTEINENRASYGGAVYLYRYGTLQVDDADFDGNYAYYSGGDVWMYDTFDVDVTGSRFTDSTSANATGGSFYLYYYGTADFVDSDWDSAQS